MCREYVWLECTETGLRNYRVNKETRGTERLELKKYCPKLRQAHACTRNRGRSRRSEVDRMHAIADLLRRLQPQPLTSETGVAQLAEQRIPNPQVGGSSPSARVSVMVSEDQHLSIATGLTTVTIDKSPMTNEVNDRNTPSRPEEHAGCS